MSLKVGYDIFAGSSQAGYDAGIPGLLQIETEKQEAYKLQIQRSSDNYYWDNTAAAFVMGNPVEADELTVEGSTSDRGIHPAIRRLSMRLPAALVTGAGADTLSITAYAAGDDPGTLGVAISIAEA